MSSFFTVFHTNQFNRDKVVFVDEFLGFNIYLHDKGQFWPGLEMGEFISIIKKLVIAQLLIQCSSRSSWVKLCQVLAKGY